MISLLEQLASSIAASVFLDELCFDRNKFQPQVGTWAELADLVLWMGTRVCFVQVKERAADAARDDDSLRDWFDRRVLVDAVKQLEDTRQFLEQHPDHTVRNRRGDPFPISDFAKAEPVAIVLYGSFRDIPETLRLPKLAQSDTVGPVHLIDVGDFREVLERCVTPGELLCYLSFRELHLRAVPGHLRQTEKWLFGRYVCCHEVVNVHYDMTDHDYAAEVDRLVDDTASVDLRSYFAAYRDQIYGSLGDVRHYYKVLIEVGWLPRAGMREFKRRLRLCLLNVERGKIKAPYRMGHEARDCAFVFVMSDTKDIEKRQQELMALTFLAKYDAKRLRGLGVLAADLGNDWTVVDWCWMEQEWTQIPEVDEELRKTSPFRKLKHKGTYGYFTKD